MSINKDEARRAKDLAEGLMKTTDFVAARKLAIKAQKMDSSLDNISRMISVCDVHCAATENAFGKEMDWYGILQVEQNANDIEIKKQYKRLALLLHPDKNMLPGAESAFKMIVEALRILSDREQRRLHDIKRKTWRKAAPAPSYRAQHVPNYHTKPVFQTSVNMRNIYNESRPEHRPFFQKAQTQPAGFSNPTTFRTSCVFCLSYYHYHREYINREVTCQNCKKQFVAFEIPFQSVPLAKPSGQTAHSFPQQTKFPGKNARSESQKRAENPANVASGKASIPVPGATAKNNNGKKRKKKGSESSESESSSSDSEDEFDDIKAAQDLGSNGRKHTRRSVRSKRQVSYNENLSDDDADLVNNKRKGSGENIETEEEKQTAEDHQAAESINPEEKIEEDQVENSAGATDSEEDLSSESAVKPPNEINYDDPDFSDFDTFRKESCFQVGQIWALYDDEDGMPRFYAVIKKVKTPDFLIKYAWLEVDQDEENETPDLPVSVGKFELGDEQQTNNCKVFSHLVQSKTRNNARRLKIFPKKGEIWALFKNWDFEWPSDSDSPRVYEYEYVEILSNGAEGTTISVRFLSKVEGFKCVFCPMPKDGSDTCEIPPQQFFRFSHCVPSSRLKGTEGRGVVEGWYELDPAALPLSRNLPGEEAAQEQDQQSPPS